MWTRDGTGHEFCNAVLLGSDVFSLSSNFWYDLYIFWTVIGTVIFASGL